LINFYRHLINLLKLYNYSLSLLDKMRAENLAYA
jgi:hypothetical protein